MKVKTCPATIKAAGTSDGTEDGVFEAIVATYDLDSVGDKITPGAFAETLEQWKSSGSPIPVLWSHMSMDPEYHIGVVEEVEERDEGLWVKARLDLDDDSPKAKKVYKLLKGRRVTQFSFAYDVEQGGYVEQKNDAGQDESYFELRKLKLYEVGPTLIGANQRTDLLDVKSASGHDIRVSIDSSDPAEQAAIRRAVEKAFDAPAGKAGDVAPEDTPEPDTGEGESAAKAPDQQELAAAVAKVSSALDELRTLIESDDESGNDSDPSEDDEKASPVTPATPAADAAKGAPATPGPASLRLRTGLAALAAEVDTLTV